MSRPGEKIREGENQIKAFTYNLAEAPMQIVWEEYQF